MAAPVATNSPQLGAWAAVEKSELSCMRLGGSTTDGSPVDTQESMPEFAACHMGKDFVPGHFRIESVTTTGEPSSSRSSPNLSDEEAGEIEEDDELSELDMPWCRIRTESSVGMPESPWIAADGMGMQSPMSTSAANAYMFSDMNCDPMGYYHAGSAIQGGAAPCVAMMTPMQNFFMYSEAFPSYEGYCHASSGVLASSSKEQVVTSLGDYCNGNSGGSAVHAAHDASQARQIQLSPHLDIAPKEEPATRSQLGTTSMEQRTTVMLRNLPSGFTRSALLECLDSQGFAGKYNFAYLPCSFDTLIGLSHAFVNMASTEDAENLRERMEGFAEWTTSSDNVCHVVWNDKHQGLDALVERYRNSPVMHEDIPEECKPILLVDGKRAPLPPPTRKVKMPKMGKSKKHDL